MGENWFFLLFSANTGKTRRQGERKEKKTRSKARFRCRAKVAVRGGAVHTDDRRVRITERALAPTPNRDLPFGSQSLPEFCSNVPHLPQSLPLVFTCLPLSLRSKNPVTYSLGIPNSLCSECWKGKAEGRMSLAHFMHVA